MTLLLLNFKRYLYFWHTLGDLLFHSLKEIYWISWCVIKKKKLGNLIKRNIISGIMNSLFDRWENINI